MSNTAKAAPYCVECGNPSIHDWWGGYTHPKTRAWISPAGRCKGCSDAWRAVVYQGRLREGRARARAAALHQCGVDVPGGAESCTECCEHEWDTSEGGMCISCDSEYPY